MKPPLWALSARVVLSRPAYNEGEYHYSERNVPARQEEYSLSFDSDDREALMSTLIGLLTAIRGEAR